ncbi:CD99 antigen-like protein 2 isoform X5 [Phyllobates terribilis]|uniref:CD99 antigen-like protein 2 isoform X5 n=1 Tax=Phyllobates terribilis TaxID=111132 RepID=UPI003CCB65CC
MARLGFTLVLVALVWRAHGQGDFSLEDAFDDIPTPKPKPAPKPPKIPTRNTDDFDLSDFFDTTNPPKVVPKRPTKKPDVFITTKKPRVSSVKPRKQPDPHDFSLEDALDPKNDPNKGGSTIGDKDKPKGGGNKDFSDSDLDDIMNGGYKPDKGRGRDKGDGRHQADDRDQGQEGLNAEYVKGENMEAVMVEEPQVKYSALEHQSAATPTGDPSKV